MPRISSHSSLAPSRRPRLQRLQHRFRPNESNFPSSTRWLASHVDAAHSAAEPWRPRLRQAWKSPHQSQHQQIACRACEDSPFVFLVEEEWLHSSWRLIRRCLPKVQHTAEQFELVVVSQSLCWSHPREQCWVLPFLGALSKTDRRRRNPPTVLPGNEIEGTV
ncbi:hypothetical protein H257_12703 [Aphanomyces astaci]|uniref:Uncharacterized protein n=1 Tax=Aphanomyces astaci TaxID=112090 RepID=W4FXL0_APHAT|nr:hypothetical protein H257_12703 [Aphanomyces astaci]ETV72235.1 hypothetical protein H257_12703 [Aphanomyces astaci]|eukprot:XP_009838303.1 hypothetical protein H257_12703 [Aphanomyces astaci]